MISDGHSSLLFLELGSVSFKANLIPKDSNDVILDGKEYPDRKLRNLLSLKVYREEPLSKEVVSEAADWFEEVYHWAKNSIPPANEALVVATAAFRDMEFFDDLEKAVKRIYGTTIHTLHGFIEAQLLVNGYHPNHQETSATVLFDLGGGSLEIVCIEKSSIHFTSLQIGSGRVTAWIMDGIPKKEIQGRIGREFTDKCQTIRALSPGLWHGTGGAVKSFLKAFKKPKHDVIRLEEITAEAERLREEVLDHQGCLRKEKIDNDFRGLLEAAPFDMPSERRRIYAGGILVLHSLCKHFNIRSIRLDRASVRNGVLKLLQVMRPSPLR
jgi:exopolyphosphatase/pppGpp-phosphohydrolase